MNILSVFEKITSQKALEHYISRAEGLPIFRVNGKDKALNFRDIQWNIREFVTLPHEGHTATINFSTKATHRFLLSNRCELPQPLCNTLKAYLGFRLNLVADRTRAPSSFSDVRATLNEFINLFPEVEEASELCITDLSWSSLEKSVLEGKIHNARCKAVIQSISSFDRRILPHLYNFPWKCTAAFSKRTRPSGKKKNPRRSISHLEVFAIADLFHMATSPRHQMISSILALLCCAPSRIGEVWRLPFDCEVVADPTANKDGELDPLFEESERFKYGLRWWPQKGGKPMIKLVPEPMIDVAQQAILRLREHTQEAREFAAKVIKAPGKLPLPPELQHIWKTNEISNRDIRQLLGRRSDQGQMHGGTRKYFPSLNSPRIASDEQGKIYIYDFRAFERDWWKLFNLRNPSWPYVVDDKGYKLRADQALLTCFWYQFDENSFRNVSKIFIQTLPSNIVDQAIKGTITCPPIWESYDIRLSNGEYPKFDSHGLRHWLNTIAQRADIPQALIAHWSGRSNIMQNVDYDRTTADELIAGQRKALNIWSSELTTNIISEEDALIYDTQKKTIWNSTPYGLCYTGYAEAPCDHIGGCLDCSRLVCVAGAALKTSELAANLARWQQSLADVLAQKQRGKRISPGFESRLVMSVEHGKKLLEKLNDSKLVPGSLIPNISISEDTTDFALSKRDEQLNQNAVLETVQKIEKGEKVV